ncbi:hypothetical protein H4V95_001984 [Arthrobacter sp. CAN_C5]|nr:hypothetical protein [Arthrobacter sp. CAN_C5]
MRKDAFHPNVFCTAPAATPPLSCTPEGNCKGFYPTAEFNTRFTGPAYHFAPRAVAALVLERLSATVEEAKPDARSVIKHPFEYPRYAYKPW